MAEQERNRRNNHNRRAPPAPEPEALPGGSSIKYAIIVVVIAIFAVIVFRVNNHWSSLTTTMTSFPETPPEQGRLRYDGRGQPNARPYDTESQVMQRIISKYASMQRSGEKNDTAEGILGKKTGTFMLDSDETSDDAGNGNKPKKDEDDETDLDEVDLAFVDSMIHDIQETKESKHKLKLEQRVNELERKLGRKLTKYTMTTEELDADTTLDDDERQSFEFRNVRQGFVDIWRTRMRELKRENYEKYFRLPEDYTMQQKATLLRRNFEAYVAKFWDQDTKKQKRSAPDKSASKPPSTTEKPQKDISPEVDEDTEIMEILQAIHFTPEYEERQKMEDELAEIKRSQGLPPPKVNKIEHIKNNFIYIEREKIPLGNKGSPTDYSFLEIEELKTAWKEYLAFKETQESNIGDGELTLDELDHVDDLIDAIERTPRFHEREYHRKRIEELDELEKDEPKSNIFSDPGNPSEEMRDMSKMVVETVQLVKNLELEFIKEERARLKNLDQSRSKKVSVEEDDEDELDIFSYREPEEYSLEEKVELKKRYDLFHRRYLAKHPLTSFAPRSTKDPSEILEALKSSELDFLDELIEDIHGLSTPGREARLDVESITAKSLKIFPGDRKILLQIENFQMRRRFIAEERARLVTVLTESKTPNEYTFDEKEEIRCRWVYFHDQNWPMEKQKEMSDLESPKSDGKKGKKRKTKEEIEAEENGLDMYESELIHHLIDEIYNQNDFENRKLMMKEFDEDTLASWELKEQFIRQKEGASIPAGDKIIQEFGRKSLAEFLKMREKFITAEKKMAKEKTKGLKQFYFMPSDMVELLNRWNSKFVPYKTKVDEMFQSLGN